MTEMNLDELEQKIRNSMQTATKQICSGKKAKCSRIKKETRDLMNIRRCTHRSNPNYREINIQVKRSIRRDIRYHNSMIKSIIENNKNMKVLKSLDKNGQALIYQMKNEDGEVKYDSDEI